MVDSEERCKFDLGSERGDGMVSAGEWKKCSQVVAAEVKL